MLGNERNYKLQYHKILLGLWWFISRCDQTEIPMNSSPEKGFLNVDEIQFKSIYERKIEFLSSGIYGVFIKHLKAIPKN